ncbi:type II secretion system protein [bacterium]|nr:type II secretion system protein [bacterium]
MCIYEYKKGFTLSEVLITLVIIGIISSVTIPALITNTQKKEFVAGLKKANSVLSQSLYKIALNNGYPIGDYSFLSEVNFIDEFATISNYEKKCNNTEDCFGTSLNNGGKYKRLNNTDAVYEDGKSIVSSDGQIFSYINVTGNAWGLSTENTQKTIGRILVDVNGQKKPNKTGLDLFLFYVLSDKGIVPAGFDDVSDCNIYNLGYTCAAKVLNENEINYVR